MATTTNYGWETPDDTDLVKDGASAIRTLGSSIDTTTKALNPSTTLGDIEYRSSTANTNTRLGIGSTGQVLTVSGGVPAWSTISAGSLTLLSTTSLSGTSITISSISQDYTHLFVVIYGLLNDTSNGRLQINPNNSTSVHSANVYGGASNGTSGYTSAGIVLSGGTDILRTNSSNAFSCWIYNYASTSLRKNFSASGGYVNSASQGQASISGGMYDSTSAITSLVISREGANITAGTCLVYGVK